MLKYMGGKAKLAKFICFRLNRLVASPSVKSYVEPFIGGGSIARNVLTSKPRLAYDLNPYLIALYKALGAGWLPPRHITPELYKSLKEEPSSHPAHLVGYAGIAAAYGGRWMTSYAHPVVAKNGHPEHDFQMESYRAVLKHKRSLKGIEFACSSYMELEPHEALVYCDPPYAGTTNGYFAGEQPFDHATFWQCRLGDAYAGVMKATKTARKKAWLED